jgi:hypothetical protein
MRVLLTHRTRHGERGAVAVIVALLAVPLLAGCAFVMDFGMAYVYKNHAQEAADAGALAAARVYADARATCVSGALTLPDPLAAPGAANAANSMRTANMPDSDSGTLEPSCDTDGTVKIKFTVRAKSPIGLGAVVTDENHIDIERHAVVKWGTSEKTVGSLRPWMICGAQIPTTLNSKVSVVYLPGKGHRPADPNCPANPNKPGNWWRSTCFNEGGSHGDTVDNIMVGCTGVEIVPGQTEPATPLARTNYLKLKCGPESVYCLDSDTGNDSNPQVEEAWGKQLGKTIAVPVFCAPPSCVPSSVTAHGNWPVWKIAAVTVCGYGIKGRLSSDTMLTGDCNDMNQVDKLKPSVEFPDHDDIGFLLIFRGLLETGGPPTFPVDVQTTMRLVE